MADNSKIEWTDATWNPITGCSVISPGCTNCYAMRLAGTRMRDHESRVGLTTETKAGPVWTGEIRFNGQWLNQPLTWSRPRDIFVCAHSDLFHPGVSDGQIMRVFEVMMQCRHHRFQVLTKRPGRALDFLEKWADLSGEGHEPKLVHGPDAARQAHPSGRGQLFAAMLEAMGTPPMGCAYPTFDWGGGMIGWPTKFANIHIGVSVERQQEANVRHNDLARINALGWTTWVSYEPALGPVDWTGWEFINQLIAGGESGPDARPSHPNWHRATRDFCQRNKIRYFFKQWGEWAPVCALTDAQIDACYYPAALKRFEHARRPKVEQCVLNADGLRFDDVAAPDAYRAGMESMMMMRIGKARSGARLDGVEHLDRTATPAPTTPNNRPPGQESYETTLAAAQIRVDETWGRVDAIRDEIGYRGEIPELIEALQEAEAEAIGADSALERVA